MASQLQRILPREAREFGFMMAKKDWGETVEAVCRALHGTGKTVRMIMDKTKLRFSDVRNSLVVLMAQNIVQYKVPTLEHQRNHCVFSPPRLPLCAGGRVRQ